MKSRKWIFLAVTLLLIGSTGALLTRLKQHQTLGRPGVKTQPLAGSENLEVVLPADVLNYSSVKLEEVQGVLDTLPPDTSYGQRRYTAPDGFWTMVNVVLMGRDRTSIHKPQFCLTGAGWAIDPLASHPETVHMDQPDPYDLTVMKLVATREIQYQGKPVTARGIYVYWFVADNALSADAIGFKRMGSSAWRLITTGVLQRWAYISYFAVCLPGQENQTYERVKKMIVASVPDYQLVPPPHAAVAVSAN